MPPLRVTVGASSGLPTRNEEDKPNRSRGGGYIYLWVKQDQKAAEKVAITVEVCHPEERLETFKWESNYLEQQWLETHRWLGVQQCRHPTYAFPGSYAQAHPLLPRLPPT